MIRPKRGRGRVRGNKHLLWKTSRSCALRQHRAEVWELPECIAVVGKDKSKLLPKLSCIKLTMRQLWVAAAGAEELGRDPGTPNTALEMTVLETPPLPPREIHPLCFHHKWPSGWPDSPAADPASSPSPISSLPLQGGHNPAIRQDFS